MDEKKILKQLKSQNKYMQNDLWKTVSSLNYINTNNYKKNNKNITLEQNTYNTLTSNPFNRFLDVFYNYPRIFDARLYNVDQYGTILSINPEFLNKKNVEKTTSSLKEQSNYIFNTTDEYYKDKMGINKLLNSYFYNSINNNNNYNYKNMSLYELIRDYKRQINSYNYKYSTNKKYYKLNKKAEELLNKKNEEID